MMSCFNNYYKASLMTSNSFSVSWGLENEAGFGFVLVLNG